MKDGWHVIKGLEVYVEKGRVIRGWLGSGCINRVPAYPYKWDRKLRAYVKGTPSVSAFRKKWFLW